MEDYNKDPNILEKFGRNIVEAVKAGKVEPVIGREDEIRRVIKILSRKTKNNPILIGEPGVGKTAIVEGLARRIVDKDVPSTLLNKTIYELDMAALIAGSGLAALLLLLAGVINVPIFVLSYFFDGINAVAGWNQKILPLVIYGGVGLYLLITGLLALPKYLKE
jgi:hypothetical protein